MSTSDRNPDLQDNSASMVASSATREDAQVPVVQRRMHWGLHEVEDVVSARRFRLSFVMADFLVLVSAFLVTSVLKRGGLDPGDAPPQLLAAGFGAWLLSGLIGGKFRPAEGGNEGKRVEQFLTSSLIFSGVLLSGVYLLDLYSLSRFLIFGTLGLHLLLGVIVLSGSFTVSVGTRAWPRLRLSALSFLALDAGVLISSFLALHWFRSGTPELNERYQEVMLLVAFVWIVSSAVVHRYQISKEGPWIEAIVPLIKAHFIALAILSFFVFGLRFSFSRLVVFSSISLAALQQVIVVSCVRLWKRFSDIPVQPEAGAALRSSAVSHAQVVDGVVDRELAKNRRLRIGETKDPDELTRSKLARVYLRPRPEVFDVVDRAIDLDSINILKVLCVDTSRAFNLEVHDPGSHQLVVNVASLNRYRKPNQLIAAANDILCDGGMFVACFEPCERRWLRFSEKYPPGVDGVLYFVDFLWNRVLPKLPFFRHGRWLLTSRPNRVMPTAEALGRLCRGGFEIVSLGADQSVMTAVLRKVSPSLGKEEVNYGLLFKQRRLGCHGEPIYVYKMRTMHPYSEYIHSYVIETNRLDESGKVKDDFRVTRWGRILRRVWIDELPMLLNLLRGDLKLVGVRPLSLTFFETYPEDLKELRSKVKPGLIPPFYADLPSSIEEVWASERRYLELYSEAPLATDLRYFLGALKNIILGGATSS